MGIKSERALKELVDGKEIIGASLLGIDGEVIASHYLGIGGTIMNLVARDNLSGKRRRRDVFPVLGRPILSVTKYERMYLGLASIAEDQFIHLVGKPGLPLATFCAKLEEISSKLRPKKSRT